MTMLRSREILPCPSITRTPTKRTFRRTSIPTPASADSIGPPTPVRTDDPPTGGIHIDADAADDASEPELGFRLPSPAKLRRSARLASRSTEAAAVELGSSGMGMDGKEMKGRRGKRGQNESGAGGTDPRSEEGGGVFFFDLNLPEVDFSPASAKKRREEGKSADLMASPEFISEECERVEVVEIESDSAQEEVEMITSRDKKYSRSEKGKGVMVEDSAPSVAQAAYRDFFDRDVSRARVSEDANDEVDDWANGGTMIDDEMGMMVHVQGKWLTLGDSGVGRVAKSTQYHPQSDPAAQRKESEKRKAQELAPKFAFFKPDDDDDNEEGDSAGSQMDDPADWPGPFSTAVKIINDREKRLESRQLRPGSAFSQSSELRIEWLPSRNSGSGCLKRLVPSLKELSLRALSENAAEIECLDGVPDELRHQLSWSICKCRKMDESLLDLFVRGSPTEVRVPDCSWATEEEFKRVFLGANVDQLAVLQLDLCGRCLPDYILSSTLASSSNKLPSLTTVSLRGAYRLSDDGLNALASAAPLLNSIDLGQCSLITATGITSLSEKLNPMLRKLYLDDCHIDAMAILPALMNLKKLEVLSVARIESITNKFVQRLVSVHGEGLQELTFTGCKRLTATSVKEISEKCLQLHSLDLRDLFKLDDHALVHLANGCSSLQKLLLRRSPFSDKAVAALLEVSGGSLTELSLNNIREVSNYTAQAIAVRCSLNLRILDLSFCRKATDEGLGLIVDSCSYLRILKVFGCRQITSTFLEGHSNSYVKIIGLAGSIVQHLEMPWSLQQL